MKTVIVIPARLESQRLPRKLLLQETGKALIQHTYESACQSELADEVIVATDSREISEVIEKAGGRSVLTSDSHQSGTDRIAEAVADVDADLVVNVQGDEPELDGKSIDTLIKSLQDDNSFSVATLATPLKSFDAYRDPACVKVVADKNGRALYFSRSPIPFAREQASLSDWFENEQQQDFLQHIGIYAYRRDCLLRFPQLEPVAMEQIESLEQLRFLHHGWAIQVRIVEHYASGIDTAEDYRLFVNRSRNG